MRVLAGDIGGTHSRLTTINFSRDTFSLGEITSYPSGEYDHLSDIIEEYLNAHSQPRIDRACFAVAGPVRDNGNHQTAQITNLPWKLNSTDIAAATGIPTLRLINDFQGTGYGIELLGNDDLLTVQQAVALPMGPRAVVGAGTGLGMGLLFWNGDHYHAYPSEGGHADFAPANAGQRELMAFVGSRLQAERFSVERVLSGSGLSLIYEFVWHRNNAHDLPSPNELKDNPQAPAMISRLAHENHEVARQALELFTELCGTTCGNVALTCLPTGGLYISGGVVQKNIDYFDTKRFINAFLNKGRLSPVLQTIPVHIITHPQVGLLGAAVAARQL